MVGKRKLSLRAQANTKRRASSSSASPAQDSPASAPVEELPTTLVDGGPLPTLTEPQAEDLPLREFQSIEESGVLGASLLKSRSRWLSESIFEKYWTKPSKRKNAAQVDSKNPPANSMTKVGTCTVTIEPHIFDTTLYTIKDPQAPSASPAAGLTPQRPIIQYGPPNGHFPVAPTVANTPIPPQKGPVGSMTGPIQPPPAQPTPQPTPNGGPPIQQPSNPPTPSTPVLVTNPHVTQDSNVRTAPKPSPDPVIQALAAKAATDADLKALMRVVASGQANHAQLKLFQAQIDELTAKINAAKPGPPSGAMRPADSTPISNLQTPTGGSMATPMNGQYIQSPANSNLQRPPLPTPFVRPEPAQPYYRPPPPPLRSKVSKPEISGVVFEFSGGSGDRFLFPKYSMLEYLPGGTQVIASFLVVRKGSISDSGNYDPEHDYYQPVTMRLMAHNPRILEPLARVVAPPDVVRKWMDNVMDHVTRAEYVHLAMRLPRDPEQIKSMEDAQDDDRKRNVDGSFAPINSSKNGITRNHVSVEASAGTWDPTDLISDLPPERAVRKSRVADPNKQCHLCRTSDTSLWRKAEIDGKDVTVCNACGIKWKTSSGRSQQQNSGDLNMTKPAKDSTTLSLTVHNSPVHAVPTQPP